jgi:hypothetical protein
MTTPELHAFDKTVATQIAAFPNSRLIRRAEAGDVAMTHYHAILTTLFHQTYSGPYSFARAAVNCPRHHEPAKEYLLRHAEEERTHWRWVLDDLHASGYEGPDPRGAPPHPTCMAYVALNHYFAEEVPVARLALAAVLEGIGATHGGTYGRKLLQTLQLRTEQASFFLSHAETDKTHIVELRDVIAALTLSADEWRWMHYAATIAGQFYRAMYDHEAYA